MCGLDKHFMWPHPWCFISMFRSTVLICFYGVILSRRCSLPWLHSSWYRSHLSRSLLPQMMWRWILMKYIVGKSDCFSACLWRICRRSWESYRCCLMLGPDVLSKCALWDSYYFLWFMQGELWNNIEIEHVDSCFFFRNFKKSWTQKWENTSELQRAINKTIEIRIKKAEDELRRRPLKRQWNGHEVN